MKAIVYKSTGSWYVVKLANGTFVSARIQGKFKIDEDITSTNPIAVGDEVDVEKEINEDIYTIKKIYDRRNYIVRISPRNKHQKHIVASNIDQCIIVATLTSPRTSNGFIDRLLITAEAYHIPTTIVFNKSDLYNQKEKILFNILEKTYKDAGYGIILMSLVDGTGLSELKNILANKTSLFAGHSGVGKSTLINKLIPDLAIKTQDVSNWSGKGMHTTTFAEMHPYETTGNIIDTPGIKELGILDVSKEELNGYFPEFRQYLNKCKFNNCLHINEPDCIVKQKVDEESISAIRYESYVNILASL